MRSLKISWMVIALSALSACAIGGSPWDATAPTIAAGKTHAYNPEKFLPRAARKNVFNNTPSGEDSYSQGWRDGCDTYLSIVGTGFYQMIPEKWDPERQVRDPLYQRGYRDGGSFCTFRLDWYIMW